MRVVSNEEVRTLVVDLLGRGERVAIAAPSVEALAGLAGVDWPERLEQSGGRVRLLVRDPPREGTWLRRPEVELRRHDSLEAMLVVVEEPTVVLLTSQGERGSEGVLIEGEAARPYLEQLDELWGEGHAHDEAAPVSTSSRAPDDVRTGEGEGSLLLGHTLDGCAVRLPLEALPSHVAVVGATGSGKTGLIVDLVEEAALAGSPVLVFDPKGDLACLLLGALTTNELERLDLGELDCPPDAALRWCEGLAEAGIDPERRRAFQRRVSVRLVTPGGAVAPCDLLTKLLDVRDFEGELADHVVAQRVSMLFRLVRLPALAATSPEHVLVSRLVERSRRAGAALELAQLAPWIEHPPLADLGGRDLERLLPAVARRKLARVFYAALESPSLRTWQRGTPFSAEGLTRAEVGRTPVTVVSLAHLAEGAQGKLAAAGLLLDEVWAWAARQPGRSREPRLVVVIDECDWAPPTNRKTPPTRDVLLALLQRGRAFGLGAILGLQGPSQLDHEAFANVNTMFVGRLASPHDQRRVVDGLSRGAVGDTDRDIGRALAQLAPRQFVLARPGAPALVMRPRHTLSPLIGPLPHRLLARLAQSAAGSPPAALPDRSPLAARGERTPTNPAAAPSHVAHEPSAFALPAANSAHLAHEPVVALPVASPATRPAAMLPAVVAPLPEPGRALAARLRFRDEALGIDELHRVALEWREIGWIATDGRGLEELRRPAPFWIVPGLCYWAPAALGERAFQGELTRRLRERARLARDDVRLRARLQFEPLERDLLLALGRAADEARELVVDIVTACVGLLGFLVLAARRGPRPRSRGILRSTTRPCVRPRRRLFEQLAASATLLTRLLDMRRRVARAARQAADEAGRTPHVEQVLVTPEIVFEAAPARRDLATPHSATINARTHALPQEITQAR